MARNPIFRAAAIASPYRPDIDGLRAIAVLSVIFFHMNRMLVPGGFVGVDVFFVISGFLISDHILRQLEGDSFSIFEFYRRRIKRIVPAMLTIVAVTLFLARLFMLPEDMIATAKSAIFAVASLANVYFWLYQDTSYFATDSRELPLLHLWSLGVEEQFYAIWPLLLASLYRSNRKKVLFGCALVVAVISFCLGSLLFKSHPLFSYYMFPTRAGELLVGALIAITVLSGLERRLASSAVLPLAAFGTALLAGSLLILSERVVFPGLAALPPTLGTALLIFSGTARPNTISRCLSVAPLVWIGLISYSMYLWHWPLLALYRYGYGEVTYGASIVILILTVLLAWLTYSYIEQPFRSSRASVLMIFLCQYALPAGMIAMLALGLIYGQPFSDDYMHRLARLRDETRPAYQYEYVCQRQRVEAKDISDNRCVIGAGPGSSGDQVLLWGDSNAAHYVGVIGAFARAAGFYFRNLEVGSCPPVFGDPSSFVAPYRVGDCRVSQYVIRPAIDRAHIIIVSASWTSYQPRSDFLEAFFKMVRELTANEKQVIIIGKAPVIPAFDRRCTEKALHVPFLSCKAPDLPLDSDVAQQNEQLRNFARQTVNVEYFEATRYLCPGGVCSAYGSDGLSLYYDSNHLSMIGSWKLGNKIVATDGVPGIFKHIASEVADDWRAQPHFGPSTPNVIQGRPASGTK